VPVVVLAHVAGVPGRTSEPLFGVPR
jgi:hypothetical protein